MTRDSIGAPVLFEHREVGALDVLLLVLVAVHDDGHCKREDDDFAIGHRGHVTSLFGHEENGLECSWEQVQGKLRPSTGQFE